MDKPDQYRQRFNWSEARTASQLRAASPCVYGLVNGDEVLAIRRSENAATVPSGAISHADGEHCFFALINTERWFNITDEEFKDDLCRWLRERQQPL